MNDQFISSKYVAVSRIKDNLKFTAGGIFLRWTSIPSRQGRWWGEKKLMLLAAPYYRNKPDVTTVLKGRLSRIQTR